MPDIPTDDGDSNASLAYLVAYWDQLSTGSVLLQKVVRLSPMPSRRSTILPLGLAPNTSGLRGFFERSVEIEGAAFKFFVAVLFFGAGWGACVGAFEVLVLLSNAVDVDGWAVIVLVVLVVVVVVVAMLMPPFGGKLEFTIWFKMSCMLSCCQNWARRRRYLCPFLRWKCTKETIMRLSNTRVIITYGSHSKWSGIPDAALVASSPSIVPLSPPLPSIPTPPAAIPE